MKCQSGRHEWTDQVDAERCCDPGWLRVFVSADERESLDPMGRREILVDGALMVRGWITRPAN
jgi:hypothetical protein